MADDTRQGSSYRWALLAAALLPVLYTLSVGPVVYLVERIGKGREASRVFYAPLIWLHDNTPLQKPLEWYTEPFEAAARR